MTEPNTNNFYLYFPGGMYRERSDERMQKIIADLDVIIEKTDFDVGEFERQKSAFLNPQLEATKLFNDATFYKKPNVPSDWKERSEGLDKLAASKMKILQQTIYPVFQTMLELGYKREDLVK